ncbi:MAG TPA: PIN domain-containing protein [Polyangiaceae bacterium]
MKGALVADTGGLLHAIAATPSGGARHPTFEKALISASRVLVPSLVLAEIDYFLRDHRDVMRALAAEIFDPKTTYEYVSTTPEDVARALVLDARFAELEIGLVDGVVAAVAERTGTLRVLTTDRRDFGAIRVGPRWDRALVLVP